MSQLREQTATLAEGIKEGLAGNDDTPHETRLRRAWTAYRLADVEGNIFGARSVAWIGLSSIFDTIKDIEEGRTLAKRCVYSVDPDATILV